VVGDGGHCGALGGVLVIQICGSAHFSLAR
jgi:hypothetical protein